MQSYRSVFTIKRVDKLRCSSNRRRIKRSLTAYTCTLFRNINRTRDNNKNLARASSTRKVGRRQCRLSEASFACLKDPRGSERIKPVAGKKKKNSKKSEQEIAPLKSARSDRSTNRLCRFKYSSSFVFFSFFCEKKSLPIAVIFPRGFLDFEPELR